MSCHRVLEFQYRFSKRDTDRGRLFGYDQGVMGGLLSLDSFVKVFPEIDLVHTTVSFLVPDIFMVTNI